MNKRNSTITVVNNILNYYRQKDKKLISLNLIAKRINDKQLSVSILKNWSSGRTTPSLNQLTILAYHMSIHPSQLLIEDIQFSIGTPIWKDNIVDIFYSNFEKYNRRKQISPKNFDEDKISYRSYRETLLTRSSTVSLKKIDTIASILDIETIKLLEENDEKKD